VEFFETKQAAAILKHAILKRYLHPYAMKTGTNSLNRRVAFVDGYAGEGRYVDGKEGSPALAMLTARNLAGHRQLECTFVEADPTAFARLTSVVQAEAGACVVATIAGDISDHLDDILTRVNGIPVFIFLDPFGLMIPFTAVAKIFKRPGTIGAPATEVLINFNASGLRRIAGLLTSDKENPGRDASLARMDEVCGGTWWREQWLQHGDDRVAAEEAVIRQYARMIFAATRCGFWITHVKRRQGHRPVYYLILLTRHRDGLHLFGEVASKGLEEWRRAVLEVELKGTLFSVEDTFKDQEAALEARWIAEIYENLARLLGEDKPFRVIDRYSEVYGSATGQARQTHLRKAWKQVHKDGLTKTDSTGDPLSGKWIEPA